MRTAAPINPRADKRQSSDSCWPLKLADGSYPYQHAKPRKRASDFRRSGQ